MWVIFAERQKQVSKKLHRITKRTRVRRKKRCSGIFCGAPKIKI